MLIRQRKPQMYRTIKNKKVKNHINYFYFILLWLQEPLLYARQSLMYFQRIFLLGNPSEEILNFSKKKKVDFIVVGSLGKGMLSRVLLGSVSTSISQKAGCSVIIVR